MELNSSQGNGTPFVIKMTARAVGKSKKAEGINEIDFFLLLDELSDDQEQRKKEITEAVLEAYTAENLAFQEEYMGIKVKNGTYTRPFIVVDPIDASIINFEVKMQRYLDHVEGKSHVFYGSLFLPRIPMLVSQLIILLGQRSAELDARRNKSRSEWQKLEAFCGSWCMSIKAFYSYWKKIQGLLFHAEGRKAMMRWLKEFNFSVNKSEMMEKLRLGNM